jgi:hypothetical protein
LITSWNRAAANTLLPVGVDPHEQHAHRDRIENPSRDPRRRALRLQQGDDVPGGAHDADADGCSPCAPAGSKRINRVSRPAELLTQGGDEEHEQHRQRGQNREIWRRKRRAGPAHQPVGEEHERGHQGRLGNPPARFRGTRQIGVLVVRRSRLTRREPR